MKDVCMCIIFTFVLFLEMFLSSKGYMSQEAVFRMMIGTLLYCAFMIRKYYLLEKVEKDSQKKV